VILTHPPPTHTDTRTSDHRAALGGGGGAGAARPQDSSAVIFIQWCSFSIFSPTLCIHPPCPLVSIHTRRVQHAFLHVASWYIVQTYGVCFSLLSGLIAPCRIWMNYEEADLCVFILFWVFIWTVRFSPHIFFLALKQRSDFAAFLCEHCWPSHPLAVLHWMQSNKNGKNLWFSFLSTWVFFHTDSFSFSPFLSSLSLVCFA